MNDSQKAVPMSKYMGVAGIGRNRCCELATLGIQYGASIRSRKIQWLQLNAPNWENILSGHASEKACLFVRWVEKPTSMYPYYLAWNAANECPAIPLTDWAPLPERWILTNKTFTLW